MGGGVSLVPGPFRGEELSLVTGPFQRGYPTPSRHGILGVGMSRDTRDLGYNGIRSANTWYAPYWNAFLFKLILRGL